jgi:hypothetical protein
METVTGKKRSQEKLGNPFQLSNMVRFGITGRNFGLLT